jgi:hypothetical protein
MSVVQPQVIITGNVAANTQVSWPLSDAKTGCLVVQATGTFGGGTLTIKGSQDGGTTFYTLGTLTSSGKLKLLWGAGNTSSLYYTYTGGTSPSLAFTWFSSAS